MQSVQARLKQADKNCNCLNSSVNAKRACCHRVVYVTVFQNSISPHKQIERANDTHTTLVTITLMVELVSTHKIR